MARNGPLSPRLLVLLALVLPDAATAQVLSHQKISSTEGGFTGGLDDGDNFGRSLASPGDLDGDGNPELAVGALLDDDGGSDRGAVWILFLAPDGTVQSHQKISSTSGGFTGMLDDNDRFGVSLASAGDLDGNGTGDLLAGAFLDDDGGMSRGAVWILLLDTDGTVLSHRKISDTEGGFGGTLFDVDGFGRSVTCLGDVDGNGVVDLAVGAPGTDDGGPSRGAVWILFLDTDLSVLGEQKISSIAGDFTGAIGDNDEFGVAAAGLGDLDGDGTPDVAVAAPGNDDGGVRRGAVWILFLHPDGRVKSHRKISDTQGGFAGELDDLDLFGVSLAADGDLDGDGVVDLAAGARRDDDGGLDVGAGWLLFLRTDGTVKAYQKISGIDGGFTGALDDEDELGSAAGCIGDLDGDGLPDLALGAKSDDDGGSDRGAVWMLFLDTPCFNGTVNAGAGPVTDVLRVNGESGTVCLPVSTAITVTQMSAPMGPAQGRYVTWVWPVPPRRSSSLTIGPGALGCFVNPTPLHAGGPQPFRCLRGSLPGLVCAGVPELPAPASTTPWSATKASGLSIPMTLSLQGLVEDAGSAHASGFSVTNAVVLKVE